MMCELPTNAMLADEFLEYFDGLSIGSNDLTQLTLGLDRDSAIVAQLFDERDPAVQAAGDGDRRLPPPGQIRRHLRPGALAITPTWRAGWSSRASSSMSLNPDTVVETWLFLAQPAAAGGSA